MKTRFIRIIDISEIETSKATAYDLHNRYIDQQGNMYGLKYNREKRKIEIKKIIRTPIKTADFFEQRIVRQQRNVRISGNSEGREGLADSQSHLDDDSINLDTLLESSELEFNPEFFITNTIELMQRHIERFNGVMNNIKNSRVIAENDRMTSNQMSDIFRNLEIDGIQRIEKIISNYKEIKNYPRSITYYQAKLDVKGRDIIEKLDGNSRKMRFILHSEIFFSIRILYRTLQKILKDLEYFLETITDDDINRVTYIEKQYFQDGKISVSNTIMEVVVILKEISMFEEYIFDLNNYLVD